jgi:hypothetical protein
VFLLKYGQMKWVFLLTCFFVFGCSKEIVETREYPRVKTLAVSNITDNGVVFNAEIMTLGDEPVMEQGFMFGTYARLNMVSSQVLTMNGVNAVAKYKMDVPLGSFPRKSIIYVRAYVKTASITVVGNVVSFNVP